MPPLGPVAKVNPAFGWRRDREREVIQLLAEVHHKKQIAQKLGISIKPVETHRTALMRKIGVKSIVELVRLAVRNHLTEP